MEQKQQPSISEEQIWEKIEEMGGFEKLAQKEEFFKCERVWWELPADALKSIKDPSPEVKTALEVCIAVLEFSKGNLGYQPKDFTARILSKNIHRVIKASLEARVKQKAKNALAGKASAEKRKNTSAEESQYKPAQEYIPLQESAREDTSQHVLPQENTSQQESTRANHTTITEQNRTEQNRTETETEEEPKEREKYKTTTTNNSSSGKFSLSVSKTIEAVSYYHADSYKFACSILVNNSGGHAISEEEELALALYFVTDKSQSSISRITGLMDEVVRKGAKKESDILSEVSRMAMRARGNGFDFEDKEKCRVMTGSIVNYLKELIERQSNPAAFPVVRASIPSKQPSPATPQETPAEQSPQDNSRQMAQINPAFLRGETDVPF